MSKKQENPLVKIQEQYVTLKNQKELKRVLEANLGGRPLSIFDLERIKVPPAGGTHWQLMEAEGMRQSEELVALTPYRKDSRDWWRDEYGSGASGPPDCHSDEIGPWAEGKGDNGTGGGVHKCEECANGAWGSDRRGGAGKDCRDSMLFFLLREGRESAPFPSLLVVPPGSLGTVNAYLSYLTQLGIPFYEAMHRFKLQAKQTAKGLDYAQIVPSLVRRLEPDEIEAIGAYSQHLAEVLKDVQLVAEE